MKNLARHIYRRLRAQLLQRMIPLSQAALPAAPKDLHIEVIGFFHSISGIGESARLCAQQLVEDGCKVSCTSVEKYFRKPQEIPWDLAHPNNNDPTPAHINCRIFHLNPPMLPPVILQMGLESFKQTYNIGYWAWELESIPDEWINALRYMNAIITPSAFTTRVIQRYTDIPVLTATHPVAPGEAVADMRERLQIPSDGFLVSSIFSFGSAMERKNPQGLVSAFIAALADKPDAYLVLKANAGSNSPEKQSLLKIIAEQKNILLVDQSWSRAEVLGLVQNSDLYASLHRSEGFGLTLAEAMLLGTPVMATAWSGNMDFCTDENSFLIPFTPVNVVSGHPEFRELHNAVWADADLDYAAKILCDIYQHRALLGSKSACCARDMQTCINSNKYEHALQQLMETQQSQL
uniref:glycosyltransferase family 4 protein n=1 Tax=Cellvibrio fontiphilus TaxID=1815559 RepID=UPI002B4BD4F3|nr:glycosyltransferase family 4 protein [Cellvibrio fontiphilus]